MEKLKSNKGIPQPTILRPDINGITPWMETKSYVKFYHNAVANKSICASQNLHDTNCAIYSLRNSCDPTRGYKYTNI